jgi:hypothetical protein
MRFKLPSLHNPLKFFLRTNRANFQENLEPKISENKINRNYKEDGSDIKWDDTVAFTFPITGGRVIKVYDADTITIASKLPYDASPMSRLSVPIPVEMAENLFPR